VEAKRSSGLITVNEDKNTPGKAEVVKVFEGLSPDRIFHEGQTVLYNRSNVMTIEVDGEKYLLTTERDVYAVLPKETK
jgi:co-chaperonin GroES (HSP10)